MKNSFKQSQPESFTSFRIGKGKRVFDIVFASLALLVASPFMVIIYLMHIEQFMYNFFQLHMVALYSN